VSCAVVVRLFTAPTVGVAEAAVRTNLEAAAAVTVIAAGLGVVIVPSVATMFAVPAW